MEESHDYKKESLNDIVFEGRNKAYGAYYLRKIHSKTQWMSLFAILFIFLLSTTIPLLRVKSNASQILQPKFFDTTQLILLEPPSGIKSDQRPVNVENLIKDKTEENAVTTPNEIIKPDAKDDPQNKGTDKGKDTTSKGGNTGGNNTNNSNGKIYGYNQADIPPVYKSGDDELYAFLQEKTVYPSKSMKSGMERDIILVFVVELDGTITNVHVEGNHKDEFAEEAIRVIKMTSGHWKPSMVGKTNVRSINKLPFSFVNPYQ